jgi:hypothetical protein
MKIFFDSALDGRIWSNWSDKQKGRIGELSVGQLGMLGYLETILGLRGPEISEGVRVASLVPIVQEKKDSFWARSAEVDPFGVARELLRFYDFLIMSGWQQQPLTPRLVDLASLSKNVLPGVGQRLEAVLSSLNGLDGDRLHITLLQTVDQLPLLWQRVFKGLQKVGVCCAVEDLAVCRNTGNDVGAARAGVFSPAIDGSLQLIRQHGVVQAAEDIAAWLAVVAAEEGLDDTLIIGGDVVLDNALHRFGLPVTGAAEERGNSLTQLLPLVLAMGWDPPDPARILELLTLPASPVPSGIGRNLSKALNKWPALGSELWKEKLNEGLAAIEDKERRERTAERLQVLFSSDVVADTYPVTKIRQRVELLTSWLRARFPEDAVTYPALGQCKIFLSMLEVMRLESVNEPLLKRLVDEATSSLVTPPSIPAQAGLAAVPKAEAIVGEAKRIIWWNFSRDTVPPLTEPLLSEEERKALSGVGVQLPDSAMLANSRAKRWRRPLDCAKHQLMLVCPKLDGLGEEIHPHPLWDELLAASDDKAKSIMSERVQLSYSIPTVTPTLLPLPQPQVRWQVAPGMVKPREVESPSSLENFLGCPLKWTLQYNALIRSGHLATLPDMVPTKGSLAHALLEEVLLQETLPSADDGAALAGELFDRKAPGLVATLFQEGMEAEREDIRNTVVMATRSLLQHLHAAGTSKITVEQHLEGTFGSQKLQGWADIVLDDPFTVIDMKRSWAKFYKKKMASGTALQIVIYGWLLKEARGFFPALSYYTLEDQTFLISDAVHFPNGEEVEIPPSGDVWQAFEDTFNEAWQVLNAGIVSCPGNGDDKVESRLEDDRLILEPPCKFCDYDVLCGRRFA